MLGRTACKMSEVECGQALAGAAAGKPAQTAQNPVARLLPALSSLGAAQGNRGFKRAPPQVYSLRRWSFKISWEINQIWVITHRSMLVAKTTEGGI